MASSTEAKIAKTHTLFEDQKLGFPYAPSKLPTGVHGRVDVAQLATGLVWLPDGRTAQWWCEADKAAGGALYAVSDGTWLTRRAIETMTGRALY